MKKFGKDKNLFYIVLFFVGVIVVVFFVLNMRRGTDSEGNPEPSFAEIASAPVPYTNPDFKVSLKYPQGWQPDLSKKGFRGNHLSFRGEDGYFGIDAIGAVADIPIDQAVYDLANVIPPPYGLTPTIASTTVAGMEARLIAPSSDQPPERQGEVAIVVRYPEPFVIATATYFYLILYGDRDNLQTIADTLQFIN
ncbi:MAG: hypothetical protein A2945_04350 [Candidatus Liptonbacteria bacterium RIFCSPLOWO2_01_FULL_52_25]|uniref:PsbP C-terminal domain-containing protein n=1 Tax=Candidatus Liptonbacteria bacterium RIFCSPLOWO2_01_FULL_52_25 TaxID=1798650 RepID=A0A1G2CGA0_9BACT|nr:MAG: hypothetical protein A2945_04350 [Candidatus Liptonbacteria bacterium RIFCSPLOWO2_01_FULL_52_25]